MIRKGAETIDGRHGKPILIDVRYPANGTSKPVLLFIHGFKGFKDWGHFNLVADAFAEAGFVVVKFNLSHNGTTPDKPTEFTDLQAFGHNNFNIELDDTGSVIDWLQQIDSIPAEEMNLGQLFLLGHSRGGSLAILKANGDRRIKKIVTWSAVSDFARQWDDATRALWEKEGVIYIPNARTGQKMPLYYQLWENYRAHKNRLHVPSIARKLQTPWLIIHGTADESVSMEEAKNLQAWNPAAQAIWIEGAGHTFGGYHPYDREILPDHTRQAVAATIDFFR